MTFPICHKKGSFYMEINEKQSEPMCPVLDIDGFIADGKQYDLQTKDLCKQARLANINYKKQ